MGTKKITELDPLSGTPAGTDIVPMVDKSGTPDVTKKVTVTNLMAAAPVQSVAGDTGVVTLDTGDISGLGTAATTAATDYATSAQGTKADTATQPLDNISSLTNDSSFITSAGAPVQSVAGDTGVVTLDTGDISGLGTAATTAATDYATSAQGTKADTATQPLDNISSLTNDSSFITSAGAPVQSVAGDTGVVTLDTGDISGLGTAATLNTGTSDGDVVLLDSTGLPAVDGSQLTGVTAVASPTRSFNQTSVSTWTLLSSDAGKVLILTDSTGVDVTVPNSLGAGFTCDLIQGGAGPISMVAGSGVTLYGGASGTALDTAGENCMITLTLENTGVLGYVTGQVTAAAAYTGREWTTLGGSDLYFDDLSQNVYNMMSPSWGGTYLQIAYADLAGKWKRFDYASNSAMQSEIQTALGTSGSWLSSSIGSGSLYAINNSQVASSTNEPLYVWADTAGTTVTALTDSSSSIKMVPIIMGLDFANISSYGPVWGLTMVYDEGGNVEETGDAYGSYNGSGGMLYAPYVYGTTSSDTQTSFQLVGNNGSGSSGYQTSGDQT